MKKIFYLTIMYAILLLSKNTGLAQSVAENADLLYSVEGAVMQSVTAARKVSNNKIALLNRETQTIDLYSLSTNTVEKTINLPCYARDFDYANGKYFVLDFDKVSVVDSNGVPVQTLPYKIPKGEPFALETFRIVNGQNIINTADEKAWKVTETGLELLDGSHWILENGFKVRTERLDVSSFNMSVIDNSGMTYTSTHSISEYDIPDYLAVVKMVSADNDQVALDIEVATNNDTGLPKRYLVFTDLQGQMISKTEIPFVYAADIQNRFLPAETGIEYLLSAPNGLNVYKITPQKHTIQLPANCPSVFYNEMEGIGEPFEEQPDNEIMFAPQAGTNSVTRTQVWENAMKFRDLQWVANSSNKASCDLIQGGYVLTPTWINYLGGTNTSVPYKWGGFTDWSEFAAKAAEGKKTGNIYCYRANPFYSNYQCLNTPGHSNSNNNSVIGVDCSGFVSRCWELIEHIGTENLHNYSTNLGGASTTSGFNNLQVGDIINYSGSHTRLCLDQNPTGTGTFIESRSGDWRVFIDSYSPSNLSNYTSFRYNNISDARLRLAQAITVSPSNPVLGGTLTVTFKIGNYGTESWTGTVHLWRINPDGSEVSVEDYYSAITLSAGSTSQLYTYTSYNVHPPAGVNKFVVRVKNSNAPTSGIYNRSYKVGGVGHANPQEFTISSGGSSSGCTDATYGLYPNSTFAPSCTGSNETIETDCYAGEYSRVSVSAGTSYTFSSSMSSDFITITNFGGTTVLATGTGSVSYTPTSATIIRFYTHTNSNCGTSNINRIRRVKCDDGGHGTDDYFQVTTQSSPSNGGTTSGGGTYTAGSSHTVTATPNNGYTFSNWTENGSVVNSNSSYTFTLSGNINLVANFTQNSSSGTCSNPPEFNYPLPTPTTSWQTDNWQIDGAGGCEVYHVDVTSGAKYTFKTGCGNGAYAGFDTKLYLYDNNGNLLTSNDDGCESNGADIIEDYEISYTGDAYLKVKGATSSAYGAYTVAYISDGGGSNAGCTNATYEQWPPSIFTPSCTGSSEIIHSACFAGEYSEVSVSAGTSYTFSSSMSSDFITIANATGTNILTTGTGSVNWAATSTTTIRFYTHTGSNCGAEDLPRSRNVTCNSSSNPPANDNCSNAINLTCGVTKTGTLTGATPTANVSYSQSNKNDVFYYFTAVNEGDYTVTLDNCSGDFDLLLYENCNTVQDLEASTTSNPSETVTHYCTSGTSYRIRITDYSVTGGTFNIKVECPTAGDIYEYNNTESTAYSLNINFSSNSATVNTAGSDFHTSGDIDYYKIVLPSGYSYTITPRLHDSYASDNGLTYTVDAAFSYYSPDDDAWSDRYDTQSGSFTVTNGGTVYFKVTPYTTGNMGTYLLEVNISRTANFSTYTITATAGANGGISPSGSVSVTGGNSQTFTITPNSGYQISQVLVDGSNVGAVSSYPFSNVTANHTISASFSPLQYTITASADEHSNIYPSGEVIVDFGNNQVFTFTFNEGYELEAVLINGTYTNFYANSWVFSNVISDCSIHVISKAVLDGIEDVLAKQLFIFPNPVKKELFIKTDLTIEKIEIYSLTGSLLLSEDNFTGKISMQNLAQGVYLLKAYTDKGLAVSKIVKER